MAHPLRYLMRIGVEGDPTVHPVIVSEHDGRKHKKDARRNDKLDDRKCFLGPFHVVGCVHKID